MKPRTLKYHIKKGSKNIIKNGLMSVASIASVFLCSFILILSLTIAINLSSILEHLENTMGISLYLGEDISDDEVSSLLTKLQNVKHVSNIEYVSKADALKWAKDELGNSDILDSFEDDNPFPRSFEIYIDTTKNQASVLKELENIQQNFEKIVIKNRENIEKDTPNKNISENKPKDTPMLKIGDKNYEYKGIYKIKHTQKEANLLLTINNTIRVSSIVIIIILAIISIAIIVNTIKLTVYIRKAEINIMKYIGATDWFIRLPFIIEGLIIGLAGSAISIIVSIFGYNQVVSILTYKLNNMIDLADTSSLFLLISPIALVLGALLGVIGSLHSIKKYLNV